MELGGLIGVATIALVVLAGWLGDTRLALPLGGVALVAFMGVVTLGIGPRWSFGYNPSAALEAVTLPALVLDAAALTLVGVALAYDARRAQS